MPSRLRRVAIIQARMGSTRLPGKVLMDLAGEPMLVRVVNRTQRAKTVDEVVVATTTESAEDVIVNLCEERGWPVFRGSQEDLLQRYYEAAMRYKADVVVRITSDCPLIEPEIIDGIVQQFLAQWPGVDYASNTQERMFPRGLDVEVLSFGALEKAWHQDRNPAWREHVTPYIYRHPGLFRILASSTEKDYSYMRWTVDTAEDLAFVRKVYGHFKTDEFSWHEVISLLEAHPEWLLINQQVHQKVVP